MNRQDLKVYFKEKGFNPDEIFRQMAIAKAREQKEEEIKTIIEAEGLVYVGIQQDENNIPIFVLFNNSFGSTLAVKYEDFSIETVRQKLNKGI
jgi:hypothetical protein